MNSYLGLVLEYEKAHKKKNRLTVTCIAISVMLVTAIFSMADTNIKAEINGYIKHHGNYHVILNGISDDTAEQIGNRDNIKFSGWLGSGEDTVYQGKELYIQGGDCEIAGQMNLSATAGEYPSTENEALLDKQGLEQYGLSIGDTIDVSLVGGQSRQYTIVGTFSDFSSLKAADAHGLYLSIEGVRAINSDQYAEYYYIQFDKGVNIRRATSELKAEYGLSDEQVSDNTRLLTLMGQSDDNAAMQLYLTAGVLFVLVTMAGVFMIAGSFNMNVLERTQFFGLLRCLGASKRQIKRYIRLESLRYSLKGVPIGLFAGCAVTWVCVLILNMADLGDKLPEMPLFQISLPGVAAGIIIGILVVMLASGAPAKKAAGVSPQAAVVGNINQMNNQNNSRATNGRLHIDTAMGIQHAFSNKKNMVLTAGSFALSIILFLSFTVLIDFMQHATNPLKPYAPDISVTGADNYATVDRSVIEEIKTLPHIRQLYGRMFCYDIEAISKGQNATATLLSYDKPQFKWAKKALIDGKIENAENGGGVLVGYTNEGVFQWKVGDTVTLSINGNLYELLIAGILSDTPYKAQDGEWIVVCSESTFTEITGINDYTIIDMQVDEDISAQVRGLIPADMKLRDRQQGNQTTLAAYSLVAVFVYGFLFVIALISFINILNMVSASVSNRMNNYGVMRAVGMSGKQLKKIVTAEAAAYAGIGCMVGSVLGILLHRFFFGLMVTSNWGTVWQPSLFVFSVVILATILTTFVAVISPTKKIKEMSIVDVVNAQ